MLMLYEARYCHLRDIIVMDVQTKTKISIRLEVKDASIPESDISPGSYR